MFQFRGELIMEHHMTNVCHFILLGGENWCLPSVSTYPVSNAYPTPGGRCLWWRRGRRGRWSPMSHIRAFNLTRYVLENATDYSIFFCFGLQKHPRPQLQLTPSGPTLKRFKSFPLTWTPGIPSSGRPVLFTLKQWGRSQKVSRNADNRNRDYIV